MTQASPSTVGPHAAATPRTSACPGLLRIVAASDGGICRIKLPGGELSADQAHVVAGASERHAAGVIELTNRANLQVRGVRSGHEAALVAELVDAALGPTALQATDAPNSPSTTALSAADDVRNVMISPAAGRDPFALIDTTPLCAQLLTLLQSEWRFTALSPKFALLLDGGEHLARIDHPHDIWFAATPSHDGVRFVFGLAGCPPALVGAQTTASAVAAARSAAHAVTGAQKAGTRTRRSSADGTRALAGILPSQVVALVRALLHTFLDLAPAEATRMRHLLATHDVDPLLQHAQRYLDFPLSRDATFAEWQRSTPADPTLRLGAHAQRVSGTWHAGGQPPLGRLSAAMLRGLAALAQQHGNGTLRATPWQSVLLPDIPTHALPATLARLNALGLACDPAQPMARLVACAGSSGCAKSLADTKADALQLAERLPANVDVHLSGCARSCAAAHCAPYTLLAAAPGRYDLYRRDGQPGFGQCVAHHLTIAQAADMLDHLSRSNTDA
ncbi:oxidoreductase [Paraburkholderia sp. DGU8]|uniref:oxidoreductase n=1 Tax=Paraburkholderia sp. DGU8 TaxID=3161997 RepID=UPI00346594AF